MTSSILPLPVDHVGIAVANIEESIELYCGQFGHTLMHREELVSEQLSVAFLSNGASPIELISPHTESGPVAKFLKTRGPGMHHLCFQTPDIRSELKRLAAAGMRLIDSEPRIGSRGKLIAFIHPSSAGGTLIELCQK